MEYTSSTENSILGFAVSTLFALIAWISIQETQTVMAIAASCVAMISGGFVMYDRWLSIKERKNNLKK